LQTFLLPKNSQILEIYTKPDHNPTRNRNFKKALALEPRHVMSNVLVTEPTGQQIASISFVMALNSLFCGDVPLSNYSLTPALFFNSNQAPHNSHVGQATRTENNPGKLQ